MKTVRVITHAPHLGPKPLVARQPENKPPVVSSRAPQYGPPLWDQLHRRALNHAGDDTAWLAQFERKIPCGSCRIHWRDMLASTPPDWSNYFEWTWARHNEINAKLGKPIMDLNAALDLWVQK